MEKQKEWTEKENKQRRDEEEQQKEQMPSFNSNSLSKIVGNNFKMPSIHSMPNFNNLKAPKL